MRAFTRPRRVQITLFIAILAAAGCNRSREIPADTPKPRLYHRVVVLCIGINDYASPKIKDLSYAEPDATALAERLRTLYGYETVLLLGKDATRAAIGKKLREYKEQLGEKDVLIVYFAGHGQVIELPSHGRAGFLVPQDADLDLDDRGNLNAWAAEALEMRGLVDSLADMRTHHVLLIADACCSGFMTKRGAFEQRKDLHLLLSEPSRVVLAATTERQAAAEDWKTGHGFFTGALLEQVARKDAASVTDLFVEIRKRVSHDAKEMLPQMAKVGDGDGEFVFIPLEVPEHDIQVALRGGLEHALKGVYERAMRRVAQRTRLEDVLDVFNAVDYRFSTKPREREKVWQEKFERFEENAQIGDELAMVALHYCYAKGLGADKDAEKAYRWAMRAYEAGHGAGKHALAHCYAEGLGVGKNKAAAESMLRDSADFVLSKYALHEEMLGALLSTPVGEKVPLDAKVSLGAEERTRLIADLQAAADGGVERARCKLAYLSCYGIKGIVEAKPKESLALLEAEARKGSPVAHHDLACLYWNGIPGVMQPDPQKLLFHGRTAAEAGLARAQALLADAYLHAPGMPRDYAAARQWAELAESQGNTSALVTLFELHFDGSGVPKDLKKAAEYAERGDAAGQRRAIFYRGILYWNGDYYPQDRDKAVPFFERAGQLGEADGWFWAGRYYSWKYWGALAHHQPASCYGEEAAYCYAKAHYMGNKEAWEELIGDFARYGKEADIRIRREEEESASPPPAR